MLWLPSKPHPSTHALLGLVCVCLAVGFKSAWGMHPNAGIQSSSRVLLQIILTKTGNAESFHFPKQPVTSREGQENMVWAMGEKSTISFLLGSFIPANFYLLGNSA